MARLHLATWTSSPHTSSWNIKELLGKKATERTSCFTGALRFSTHKASSKDDLLSKFECRMTRIPLFSGYTPTRWKKVLDVMILKNSGWHQVDSLCTIVLFQPDCNYAFKFVGQEMMSHAEHCKSLAPEQLGSKSNHRAMDQAMNKTLTNDILQQTKHPGAICANVAKSCYDLIVHTMAVLAMRWQGDLKVPLFVYSPTCRKHNTM